MDKLKTKSSNILKVRSIICHLHHNIGGTFKLKHLYSKNCLEQPLSKRAKMVFKTNYCLMQVKSIAECSKGEHSAILSIFIKLLFVIKTFILSIYEWPLKTGFTVLL